jgi:hypothetical protein
MENLTELPNPIEKEISSEEKYLISEMKLKMKIMTTLAYKDSVFERMYPVRIQVNSCIKSCYDDLGDIQSLQGLDQNPQKLKILGKCVKDCRMAEEDMLHFYRNIDFMSLFKVEFCIKGCKKKGILKSGLNIDQFRTEKEHLDCYFSCYSRLDRRYRMYWKDKRNDILARYYGSGKLNNMYE